jgi:signal transduction histidine kinase
MDLLQCVVKEFTPIVNERKIKLITNFNGNIHIFSDKDRINQVFSNLIKNAMDFVSTNNGIIEIGVNDRDNKKLEFFVQDNGSGISNNHQKDIFKKFYQIDTSSSRKKSGSGLGLAICKGIIEGLGGKMWVKSEKDIQTTFYFEIPKKPTTLSIKNISK